MNWLRARLDRIVYGLGAVGVLTLFAIPPWSVEIGKQRVLVWFAHPWLRATAEAIEFQQRFNAVIDTPALAVEILAAAAITVLLARAFRP